MNEKQTPAVSTVRPTKKQRELLTFIEAFINEHGYSPSYREIMAGLNYTSVATVALHVNSLIKRGHLRKRDYNARSLEVVTPSEAAQITTNQVAPGEEKWLIEKIEHRFNQATSASSLEAAELQALNTLIEALRVLGLEGAAQSFVSKLAKLRDQPITEQE
jgi:SOS-response transcriptional repressor LexA